jgi:hypothetical protein
VQRLAQVIGINRRPKDPPSIEDWLRESDDDGDTNGSLDGGHDEQNHDDAADGGGEHDSDD